MSKALSYRPDIDGLRAIAVLSVVIFHINALWMPNGFLGVDMFFILSGYLISFILYRDISEGNFSYSEFYKRRIKRILPAFFAVVFFSLALAYYIYIPTDVPSVENSALASVFFMANLLFSKQGGYFDVASEVKPLLHIWSLSIEEQFYFLFPIILILVFKIKNGKKYILEILVFLSLLCLFSAFIPESLLNNIINGLEFNTYYLPHIRFGELLIGSILAVFHHKYGTRQIKYSNAISILSIIVLFVSFFIGGVFVSPYFPGIASVIPGISTAILIYVHAENETFVKKILSSRAFVFVGKISYSLYLWHWVVLAYIRYFWGSSPLSIPVVIFAVLSMIVLSLLSYYIVESPIRKSSLNFKRSFIYLYTIPSIVVCIFFFYPEPQNDIPDYLTDYRYQEYISDTTETFDDYLVGDKSKEPKILIAGDSQTGHLIDFFDKVGKKELWSAHLFGHPACPFFLGYDEKNFSGRQDEISLIRNRVLSEIYKKYDIIILSNYWGVEERNNKSYFIEQIKTTLDILLKENKKVYMVYSTNNFDNYRLRELMLKKRNINIDLLRYGATIRGDRFYKEAENADKIRNMIAKEYPTVRWIDICKYIPDDLLIDGYPIMKDPTHFNTYGAKKMADIFMQNEVLISDL